MLSITHVVLLGWSNETKFPPKDGLSGVDPNIGFDPIIGQRGDSGPRFMTGANPRDQNASLNFTEEWVVSKGGEYFFAPSISVLTNTIGMA